MQLYIHVPALNIFKFDLLGPMEEMHSGINTMEPNIFANLSVLDDGITTAAALPNGKTKEGDLDVNTKASAHNTNANNLDDDTFTLPNDITKECSGGNINTATQDTDVNHSDDNANILPNDITKEYTDVNITEASRFTDINVWHNFASTLLKKFTKGCSEVNTNSAAQSTDMNPPSDDAATLPNAINKDSDIKITSPNDPAQRCLGVNQAKSMPTTHSDATISDELRKQYSEIDSDDMAGWVSRNVIVPDMQIIRGNPSLVDDIKSAVQRAILMWENRIMELSMRAALTKLNKVGTPLATTEKEM
jgi:hypothetical protein